MVATTVLATAIISLFVVSINAEEITSLYVISSSSQGQQCPPRYTRVNQDLNQGAGGDYIYLCYSTDPYFGQPVTDIFVMTSSSSDPIFPPADYTLIHDDLNKGAGGKYIYLMYTKNGRSALVGIDASAENVADSAPDGWTKYHQDLNQGAPGKHIYFHTKHSETKRRMFTGEL